MAFFWAHLRFPFILYVLSLVTTFLGGDLFLFILSLLRVNFQSEDLCLSFALENSQPLLLCEATYAVVLFILFF